MNAAVSAIALCFAAVVAIFVVLTVVLVSRGCIRGIDYWRRYESARYPRVLLSRVYPGEASPPGEAGAASPPPLKTGDVILFIPYAHGFFNSLLTQDIFSHVGVVIEVDGVLYLSETTHGADLGPAGVAHPGADLVPLLARLKHYPGVPLLMRLAGPPLEEAAAAAMRAKARERYPYPTMAQVARGVAGGRPPARHCFQHVAEVLKAGAVLDLSDAGYLGVSRAVSGLPGVPLPRGRRFEPIVALMYDIGA